MDETQTYLLTWRQRTRLTPWHRSGWQARQTQLSLTAAMAAAADPQELAKKAAPDAEVITSARLWAAA